MEKLRWPRQSPATEIPPTPQIEDAAENNLPSEQLAVDLSIDDHMPQCRGLQKNSTFNLFPRIFAGMLQMNASNHHAYRRQLIDLYVKLRLNQPNGSGTVDG